MENTWIGQTVGYDEARALELIERPESPVVKVGIVVSFPEYPLHSVRVTITRQGTNFFWAVRGETEGLEWFSDKPFPTPQGAFIDARRGTLAAIRMYQEDGQLG